MLVAKPGDAGEQGDGTAGIVPKQRAIGQQELAPGLPMGMRFDSVKVRAHWSLLA